MTWVRSAVFNLWFYGVTVILATGSLGLWMVHPSRALALARLWARTVLAGLGPLCGIRVVVSGREHLPTGGPALIASQHQSAFDTMVWLVLVPEAAYVLKKELLRIPLFGLVCRRANMIAVDRGAGAAAIRALLRGGDAAVAAGRQIIIFPEGTRAAPGVPLMLQPGVAALASRTGLPVIPVVTDSGQCWGRRAFRKRAGVIHVVVLPSLPAGMAREALMQSLNTSFANAASIVATAVDNSVGTPPGRLSANPRNMA